MSLTTIRTIQDIRKLQSYLADKTYIAYDCETTGLAKDSEVVGVSVCAEPDKAFYIILSEWNPEAKQLVRFGLKEEVTSLVRFLTTKQLIMHNAVYDCMIAENFFKIPLIQSVHTDTMILAHILDENNRVGLKDLAVRMYGQTADQEAREMKESVARNGGLITKEHFELYKADADILAKYGAKDAMLTYNLFLDLVPKLYEQKLDAFFYEEESMPLLKGPTYQLNTTGLVVDTVGLGSLKRTLQAECAELRETIRTEIHTRIKDKYPGTNKKNTFNINSNEQLAWLMVSQYNLEFGTLTDAGKQVCRELNMKIPYTAQAKRYFITEMLLKQGQVRQYSVKMNTGARKAIKFKSPYAYVTCDSKILQFHAHKYKWVAALIKLRKNEKILSTYIEGLESRIRYNVIQPSFLQHGTTSGRYSSSNPNFQNLPRDDKRIKNLFVARPGKIFVGADFSQLEPRVFASLSGDENLQAAFASAQDFYSTIGIPVFDCYDSSPYKDEKPDAFGLKYPKERKMAKEIALASTYGATPYRLAQLIGKSQDETRDIIESYFEKFPKVKQMMEESHKLVKRDGRVFSMLGRPRRLPAAQKFDRMYGTSEPPYEARNILNLSINHRIQSTAASICNRAMIKFYTDAQKLGINTKIVSQIHDEIIVECEEADSSVVKNLLQTAMETAVKLPGVSLQAIPHASKTIGGLK